MDRIAKKNQTQKIQEQASQQRIIDAQKLQALKGEFNQKMLNEKAVLLLEKVIKEKYKNYNRDTFSGKNMFVVYDYNDGNGKKHQESWRHARQEFIKQLSRA